MTKIKVYTTKTCPYCIMAKDYLREKGVEFEEVDVAADREAAKAMIEKSGQMGVPQIEINDKIIVGFNKAAIDEELAKLKK
ncbi:MAG: glutaredoxin domain-containing protein [Candidatus Woesearchaeota archaeon]